MGKPNLAIDSHDTRMYRSLELVEKLISGELEGEAFREAKQVLWNLNRHVYWTHDEKIFGLLMAEIGSYQLPLKRVGGRLLLPYDIAASCVSWFHLSVDALRLDLRSRFWCELFALKSISEASDAVSFKEGLESAGYMDVIQVGETVMLGCKEGKIATFTYDVRTGLWRLKFDGRHSIATIRGTLEVFELAKHRSDS